MSSGRCSELLSWYHREARDLPWRHTTDPYRIWISEIMLQQTQVKTVLPRYLAWLEQFPDIQTLATAAMDDVLKAWEGLGYYRRARFIHQAASLIVERHNGVFPKIFDEIMALPGIGRSTAGAIASFSFGQPAPVLDGNVKRVLKRWHGEFEASERALWAWAQASIDDSEHPADWNQAMMELGAIHCSPRSANCTVCPVNGHCQSAFDADAAIRGKSVDIKDVHWQVELLTSKKGIWLTKRPDKGIWAGLWTPPITELDAAPMSDPCHIHTLTHRRLHLYGHAPNSAPTGDGQWFTSLENIALPTGIHRLLEKRGISA